MNVTARASEVTPFDTRQAFFSARFFRTTEQLVFLTMVLATDAWGAVIMTSNDVAESTGFQRAAVKRAIATLVRAGVLLRDAAIAWRYTWDTARMAALGAMVEARTGVKGTPLPMPHIDMRKTWLAAERSERSRKQGNLIFGPTIQPSPAALTWLDAWTAEVCADSGRSVEAVARVAWRKWLVCDGRKDARGQWIAYPEHHDFTWLVTELRKNPSLTRSIRETLRRTRPETTATPVEASEAAPVSGASAILQALRGQS